MTWNPAARKNANPFCVMGADRIPPPYTGYQKVLWDSKSGTNSWTSSTAGPEICMPLSCAAPRSGWIPPGVSFLMSPPAEWKTEASHGATWAMFSLLKRPENWVSFKSWDLPDLYIIPHSDSFTLLSCIYGDHFKPQALCFYGFTRAAKQL